MVPAAGTTKRAETTGGAPGSRNINRLERRAVSASPGRSVQRPKVRNPHPEPPYGAGTKYQNFIERSVNAFESVADLTGPEPTEEQCVRRGGGSAADDLSAVPFVVSITSVGVAVGCVGGLPRRLRYCLD